MERRRGVGPGILYLSQCLARGLLGFACLLVLIAAVHMLGPSS